MSEPLAYLITWTTYGSWLPGDRRRWVERGRQEILAPDREREAGARQALKTCAVILDPSQREIVQRTIAEHCAFRDWQLHAVNVRSNHAHLVVTAKVGPEVVMNQLKAWTSRRLNEQPERQGTSLPEDHRWWTRHGSTKYINEVAYLHNAVRYVLERQ